MMDVAIVGTGYVGLVAGTCFAELGHRVTCVDNNQAKLETLRSGGIPIYEPGLERLVPQNIEAKRLHFTDQLAEAVKKAEVVFIAVGTPPGEDGSADLTYVLDVAKGIAAALDDPNGPYKVVVVKSTVPIGTCDKVEAVIREGAKSPFAVVSNPEFLREGVAVEDFLEPDRIVVGSRDEASFAVMGRLYKPLTDKGATLISMDVRSSEMTKYASNSMLATRISFMNEIANLCDKLGANVENVRRGMGSDRRIGPYFLKAGIGYGGSCFPKDVSALIRTADGVGSDMLVLNAASLANAHQKGRMFTLIQEDFGSDLSKKRVALWGLAFKPNTDDMREAPSIVLSESLLQAGAEVVAYDPAARDTAHLILGDRITYAESPYQALEGADILCLVTEWDDFAAPDWDKVKALMKGKAIYDGRNLYAPDEVQAKGFQYRSIGRPHKG